MEELEELEEKEQEAKGCLFGTIYIIGMLLVLATVVTGVIIILNFE